MVAGSGNGSVKTKDFINRQGIMIINKAEGTASFAEGYNTCAIGPSSHVEGSNNYAMGANSHVEGGTLIAMGDYSHIEGIGAINAACRITDTESDKQYVLIMNRPASDYTAYIIHTIITVDRINYGFITQVEKINNEYLITVDKNIGTGYNNTACSLYFSYTIGQGSHREGYITAAIADYQHVQGKWNILDIEKQYADIIGNGTNVDARSNAYALDWSGNGHYMGDVYVHANNDSTGGTKLLTAADLTTYESRISYLESEIESLRQALLALLGSENAVTLEDGSTLTDE